MTKYLLTVVEPTASDGPPDNIDEIKHDVELLTQAMKDAGVWVFAGGLYPPSSATVVRPKGDDVLLTDGPFAEGKEHMGGLTIISAPDLDAALDWAKKMSVATTLPIDVRPFRGEHD